MGESYFDKIDGLLTGLTKNAVSPISFPELLINILVAVVVGLICYYLYRTSTIVRQGDSRFGALLALIVLITAVIITFIKSSLILSIGLVGALSIVRFRTPIKDPVDLGFLFAAIAFGIGIGSSQTQYAIFACLIFAGTLWVLGQFVSKNSIFNSYVLEVSGIEGMNDLEKIQKQITELTLYASILRLEAKENGYDSYVEFTVNKNNNVVEILSILKQSYPKFKFNIIRTHV